MLKKVWWAEFTGTFAIVFLGCGSSVLGETHDFPIGIVPWVFGLTVTSMIACFAAYGGAHFNPAVTIAFHVLGKRQAPFWLYGSAQLLGAAVACMGIRLVFGANHSFGTVRSESAALGVFLWEVLGTFILAGVILRVKMMPSLVIGLTVALIACLIGPHSGGAFNPVRSLLPALFAGHYQNIVLYPMAACLGGLLAALSVLLERKVRIRA